MVERKQTCNASPMCWASKASKSTSTKHQCLTKKRLKIKSFKARRRSGIPPQQPYDARVKVRCRKLSRMFTRIRKPTSISGKSCRNQDKTNRRWKGKCYHQALPAIVRILTTKGSDPLRKEALSPKYRQRRRHREPKKKRLSSPGGTSSRRASWATMNKIQNEWTHVLIQQANPPIQPICKPAKFLHYQRLTLTSTRQKKHLQMIPWRQKGEPIGLRRS